MSTSAAMAQVNVRMQRDLKERGDAILALVGSSLAVIIRQLWQALAEGGEAYQRIMRIKADYLVTNDEGLLRHAPVAAVTPAKMVQLLDVMP